MQKVAGDTFEQGQHICSIYDTVDEQLAVAVAFVVDGLERRERCLYAADSEIALEKFRAALRRAGVDVAAAERSRSVLLLTKERAHLVDGHFDAERMLRMLNDAVEEALNDGFTGLRTCGDMSWLLDNPPGGHHVVEYEAVLNQFFRNVRALGMCQYDRIRLPVGLLDHAGIASHSTIVLDHRHKRNAFFEPVLSAPALHQRAATVDAKLKELRRV